jgi:hypothetical protein
MRKRTQTTLALIVLALLLLTWNPELRMFLVFLDAIEGPPKKRRPFGKPTLRDLHPSLQDIPTQILILDEVAQVIVNILRIDRQRLAIRLGGAIRHRLQQPLHHSM